MRTDLISSSPPETEEIKRGRREPSDLLSRLPSDPMSTNTLVATTDGAPLSSMMIDPTKAENASRPPFCVPAQQHRGGETHLASEAANNMDPCGAKKARKRNAVGLILSRKRAEEEEAQADAGANNRKRSREEEAASAATPTTPARPLDVICGRGKPCQLHPGNIRFLSIVDKYKNAYADAPRCDKLAIAATVVKEALDGDRVRFLRRKSTKGSAEEVWVEVSEEAALDKASHALRAKGRRTKYSAADVDAAVSTQDDADAMQVSPVRARIIADRAFLSPRSQPMTSNMSNMSGMSNMTPRQPSPSAMSYSSIPMTPESIHGIRRRTPLVVTPELSNPQQMRPRFHSENEYTPGGMPPFSNNMMQNNNNGNCMMQNSNNMMQNNNNNMCRNNNNNNNNAMDCNSIPYRQQQQQQQFQQHRHSQGGYDPRDQQHQHQHQHQRMYSPDAPNAFRQQPLSSMSPSEMAAYRRKLQLLIIQQQLPFPNNR